MTALVRTRRQSRYSLSQQSELLAYVIKTIDLARGYSGRDTNRAYWLGARILGCRYEDACRLYKHARLFGSDEAVRRDPNLVDWGEELAFVYFAVSPDGWLKIGHSRCPQSRIDIVSRMARKPLREIARREGFMLHEHLFQLAAKSAWLGGEWYDLRQLLALPRFEFLAPSLPGNHPSFGEQA